MKKYFYSTFFVLALFNCVAQIPVMNSISGPSNVCSSPSWPMSFSASAINSPTAYQWYVSTPSVGVIIGSPINATTTISFPYSNATYTLYCEASNGFGTSPTTSFVVNIFETPSVTFSGANSFCQGSSTNLQASSTILMASPTISYGWSAAYGLNITNQPNVIANPSVTTTYTVVATKGICSNSAQITVSVLPTPTLSVFSNTNSLCFGNSATLTINGNAITYSLNGVSSLTNAVISPTVTLTYTISGSNGLGCIGTTTLTQIVVPCGLGLRENFVNGTDHLFIYPNPAWGWFNIRSAKSEVAIITNELGQIIRTVNLIADAEIKINGLNGGIYFIITPTTKLKIVVIQ